MKELNNTVLDKETILNAAEEAIRKFGPSKTNITDIAKILNVSHAAIYRFYENKAELLKAVTERWLYRISTPLEAILKEKNSPEVKLKHFLQKLCKTKRQSAIDDPEMFQNYSILSEGSKDTLKKHLDHLIRLLENIINQGIESKIFVDSDPRQLAITIFTATTRFHYPGFVSEWDDPNLDHLVESIIDMILKGIELRT